jgi:transcriptional regulator with XRE-family HTH domain
MSNERLHSALTQAGLQPDELAEQLDVDVKTVQRWLSGRAPHARHRAATVAVLNQTLDITERDLWPETVAPPAGDDRRDLVAIYTRGDDIRIPDWRILLREAQTRIDLLDTTLVEVITSSGTVDLLREKARAGVEIRILTAHPHSIWITSLAEQLADTTRDDAGRTQLDRDLEHSHTAQEALIEQPNVDLRTHWAERTNSILRFGDQMLVTLHLWATPGTQAPVMHLRRRDDDGLFRPLPRALRRNLARDRRPARAPIPRRLSVPVPS